MATRGPPGQRGMGNRFAQFKLVLLGESAVGKSSIVLRFVKDQFDSYRESTIGAAFLTQTISLDENTTVKFEIWDTAGQERYKSLAPMYYRNANCAVVVYDITQAVGAPGPWKVRSILIWNSRLWTRQRPGSRNSSAKPTRTSSSHWLETSSISSPNPPTSVPSPKPTPSSMPARPDTG